MKRSIIKETKANFFVEHGDKMKIIAEYGLRHLGNNADAYFFATASTWRNGREDSGGCLHSDILRHFPKLSPFVRLHLHAEETAQPSHATENGAFWLYNAAGFNYDGHLLNNPEEQRKAKTNAVAHFWATDTEIEAAINKAVSVIPEKVLPTLPNFITPELAFFSEGNYQKARLIAQFEATVKQEIYLITTPAHKMWWEETQKVFRQVSAEILATKEAEYNAQKVKAYALLGIE